MEAVLNCAWKELFTLKASVADTQMRIEKNKRAIADVKTLLQRCDHPTFVDSGARIGFFGAPRMRFTLA